MVTCPNCGSKLIKKDSRRGPFLSCSNFPKCRFSMDYKPENINIDWHKIDKCPSCGNQITNNTSTVCPYCRTQLFVEPKNWVLTEKNCMWKEYTK